MSSALVKLILREICFSSFAIRNTFDLEFSEQQQQKKAIFMSDIIGMDFEDENVHH